MSSDMKKSTLSARFFVWTAADRAAVAAAIAATEALRKSRREWLM
jgi:hypothetical protein